MTPQTERDIRVYIASFNDCKSDGILLYHMNPEKGALTLIRSFGQGVHNPLYIDTDSEQRFLFAADVVQEFSGKPGGAVSAYAIDQASGALTFLNTQSSEGVTPCYVSVSRNGKFVLVANYSDGKVAVLPVDEKGRLGQACDVVQHARDDGTGQPHAHSIVLDTANRFAFAGELGLDKLMVHQFDDAAGRLTPTDASWDSTPGSGPRHFKIHPNGQYAYLINETNSTLVAFAYDDANGRLTELQTVSTIPHDFAKPNYCADLHVHSSGRFLYGSNRGHESIVIFAIAQDTGTLTLVGHEPTQGEFPRGFAIDPSGTLLLAANENSDTVVTFRIDPQTGILTPTGQVTEMPAPVCFAFLD